MAFLAARAGSKGVMSRSFKTQEEIMPWLRLALIGLTGTWLLQVFVDRAFAQANATQQFVPGELIVGYKSPQDRDDAIKDIRDTKSKSLRVRGAVPDSVNVKKIGETSLQVHIDFPKETQRSVRDNPASEYTVLEEVAKQLKDNDPRVKYAHPNWIMTIEPPTQGAPGGAKMQLQKLDLQGGGGTPRSAMSPNDPFFQANLQWDYQPPPIGMNAVGAWKLTKGSKDIVVAVLDTGILFDQEDIAGSGNVLAGYNFVSRNLCTNQVLKRTPGAFDPGDACPAGGTNSYHGTHVAGTIGAVGSDNNMGIAGVAWQVTILPVRVLGPSGGSSTDIADGIRWAAGLPVEGMPINDHPADIINMSLGGPLRINSRQFECTEETAGLYIDAIRAARQKGVIVVAAAGNGEWIDDNNRSCAPGPNNTQCHKIQDDVKNAAPAGCPGIISVAASDPQGRLAPYSNYGAVTIMAPGGDVTQAADFMLFGRKLRLSLGVWSTLDGQNYHAYNGTSQAAPHVAGAIALALAVHPEWRRKPDVIEQALRASAVAPVEGACPQRKPCGPGQLDAVKLIETKAVARQ